MKNLQEVNVMNYRSFENVVIFYKSFETNYDLYKK